MDENQKSDNQKSDHKQSLIVEFWNSKVKNFINARKFFVQSSEILNNPEVICTPDERKSKWTSPFAFALQTFLLQIAVYSLIGQLFVCFPRTTHSIFELKSAKPHSDAENYLKKQERQLIDTDLVIAEVKKLPSEQVIYFAPYLERISKNAVIAPDFDETAHQRDEFLSLLKQIKSKQQHHYMVVDVVDHLEHSLKKVTKEWSGLAIVLMAEVFRRMVNRGRFRASQHVDIADSIFLYYFTAVTFPMVTTLTVVGTFTKQMKMYDAPDAYIQAGTIACTVVYILGWCYALWRAVPVIERLLGVGAVHDPSADDPKLERKVQRRIGFDVIAAVLLSEALTIGIVFIIFWSKDALQFWLMSLNL